MDHTRDNPLKRFTAFWVAVLLVTTFGIGTLILLPLTLRKVDTAYQANSKARLEIKAEVLKAEGAALNSEALQEALATGARSLASQKPAPGSMAVPVVAPPSDAPKVGEEAPASGEAAVDTTPEPSN